MKTAISIPDPSRVDHLMAVREGNAIKQWLIFFLYGVRETAENSIQVFNDIVALKQRLEREVLRYFSARRQANAQTLIQHLYQNPMVNIKVAADLLGLQTNTAATLVNDFVKYGVLLELMGKRCNRVFWFKDYIMIFKQQQEQG